MKKIHDSQDIKKILLAQYYSNGGALALRIHELILMLEDEFINTYHDYFIERCNLKIDLLHLQKPDIDYYKIVMFNKILNLYGIESYEGYDYINVGDSYYPTLLVKDGIWYVGCIGDIVEAG